MYLLHPPINPYLKKFFKYYSRFHILKFLINHNLHRLVKIILFKFVYLILFKIITRLEFKEIDNLIIKNKQYKHCAIRSLFHTYEV